MYKLGLVKFKVRHHPLRYLEYMEDAAADLIHQIQGFRRIIEKELFFIEDISWIL